MSAIGTSPGPRWSAQCSQTARQPRNEGPGTLPRTIDNVLVVGEAGEKPALTRNREPHDRSWIPHRDAGVR